MGDSAVSALIVGILGLTHVSCYSYSIVRGIWTTVRACSGLQCRILYDTGFQWLAMTNNWSRNTYIDICDHNPVYGTALKEFVRFSCLINRVLQLWLPELQVLSSLQHLTGATGGATLLNCNWTHDTRYPTLPYNNQPAALRSSTLIDLSECFLYIPGKYLWTSSSHK